MSNYTLNNSAAADMVDNYYRDDQDWELEFLI
jgi:hypothetical protein